MPPEFSRRLAELGYVEGQNLVTVNRGPTDDPTTGGRPTSAEAVARADAIVAELTQLPVDVIVTRGVSAIFVAAGASSVPIVMMGNPGDPVQQGFVESLSRPGGNITGVTSAPLEVTTQKHLQLLIEAAPTVSRVLVVGSSGQRALQLLQAAAAELGVELDILPPSPSEVEPLFRRAVAEGANGLLVRAGGASSGNSDLVLRLAQEHRLPGIYWNRAQVLAGGLMTYIDRTSDVERRAADYVDRILRGARPADLPVELPTRYDLIVNMGTARALGLTLPPTFRVQVDELIE